MAYNETIFPENSVKHPVDMYSHEVTYNKNLEVITIDGNQISIEAILTFFKMPIGTMLKKNGVTSFELIN